MTHVPKMKAREGEQESLDLHSGVEEEATELGDVKALPCQHL